MKKILRFLTDLKGNNNREWFQANKGQYQEALDRFRNVTGKVISGIRALDPELPDMEAKDCIFRIYRDVRFSADKSPYKTRFGAIISEGGRKMAFAGYYFHIEPGASIIGGGIYRPESPILKKVRKDIFENPEEFEAIISNKGFLATFGGLQGEKLKNPPRGYPQKASSIEWLKYKSYTVFKNYTDKEVCAPDFLDNVIDGFSKMIPMIHFLNYAIREE